VSAKQTAGGRSGQSKSKSRKPRFDAQRETVKLLVFTQAVLYLASGALPGPFRVLTLIPLLILMGAGAFRLLGVLLTYLHAKKVAPVTKSAPVVRPKPTPVPAKVVATRVA
jgi:hypothetical protein